MTLLPYLIGTSDYNSFGLLIIYNLKLNIKKAEVSVLHRLVVLEALVIC